MALHGQVGATTEHLVAAEIVNKQALCTGRDAEGLTMPLKDVGLTTAFNEPVAEPSASFRIVFDVCFSPADFLDRAACDLTAKGLAHQLPAKAMTNHWNAFRIGRTDQFAQIVYPRQRVVDTHRSAHQAKAGEGFDIGRNGFAAVDGDQLPWNRARVEECGKIARPFGFCVTENSNGFHDQTVFE